MLKLPAEKIPATPVEYANLLTRLQTPAPAITGSTATAPAAAPATTPPAAPATAEPTATTPTP